MRLNTLHLLLVEDDESDAELILRLLKRHTPMVSVAVAKSAREALSILCGEPGHPSFGSPYLILLDLSLPGLSGFEFLNELRHDPQLRHNVVFVLSDSVSDEDRRQAYEYQVAGYLRKETLIQNGASFCRLLEAYRQTVAFPKAHAAGFWAPGFPAPQHRTFYAPEQEDADE